jgi:hypothetical protein
VNRSALVPLTRTSSPTLIRWTTVTGFAAGFVWFVPTVAALVPFGLAGFVALLVLSAGAGACSVVQAHRLVARDDPDAWPTEWTLALGGIGPNALVGALVTTLLWSGGPGWLGPVGAVIAGLAAMSATSGLAQLPALLPAQALGRSVESSGWRLLTIAATWIGVELGVAFSAAIWLLFA